MSYRPITDEKFWSHVRSDGDCLIWTGCRSPDGYGLVFRRHRTWRAHRWAWFLEHGTLPIEIDHICKNRACVKHLRASTRQENVPRKLKPKCGHEFDQFDKKNGRGYGARRCSICRAEQVKRAKRRYKERHG